MSESVLFNNYLNALELALQNDTQNFGYLVKGPEYFIDKSQLLEIEKFIENKKSPYKHLFDMVANYFDAKSHYSNEVKGIHIELYKKQINDNILKCKNEFKIP